MFYTDTVHKNVSSRIIILLFTRYYHVLLQIKNHTIYLHMPLRYVTGIQMRWLQLAVDVPNLATNLNAIWWICSNRGFSVHAGIHTWCANYIKMTGVFGNIPLQRISFLEIFVNPVMAFVLVCHGSKLLFLILCCLWFVYVTLTYQTDVVTVRAVTGWMHCLEVMCFKLINDFAVSSMRTAYLSDPHSRPKTSETETSNSTNPTFDHSHEPLSGTSTSKSPELTGKRYYWLNTKRWIF